MIRVFLINFVLLFLFVIPLGCSTSSDPVVYQLSPLPSGDICRIAILPFMNESEYSSANIIAQKVFTAELVKQGDFLIAQEGDVKKLFRQMEIYPGKYPDFEQLKIIADRLNVQLVIAGTILEMSDSKIFPANPYIALNIEIIEAKNGRTLWTTYHQRDGEYYRKALHFGKVHSITALIQVVYNEIIDKWFSEGLSKCSESEQ